MITIDNDSTPIFEYRLISVHPNIFILLWHRRYTPNKYFRANKWKVKWFKTLGLPGAETHHIDNCPIIDLTKSSHLLRELTEMAITLIRCNDHPLIGVTIFFEILIIFLKPSKLSDGLAEELGLSVAKVEFTWKFQLFISSRLGEKC